MSGITTQLDGELIVEVQRDAATLVQCLVKNDTPVELTTYGNVDIEYLQTTEDGTLLPLGARQCLGVDDVQTTLSADEHQTTACEKRGALVVSLLLQTVAVVIAAHDKLPGTIVLLLGDHLRHAMVGDHPHGMLLVFQHRTDARAVQSVGHIEQPHKLRLLVVDTHARCRTLPDESAAVLHRTYGIAHIHGQCIALRQHAVGQLARHGVDEAIVPAGTHHQPSLLDPPCRGDIVGGQLRILRVPRTELIRFQVEHLDTATQRTNPDTVPLVLGNAPHAVVRQSVGLARHTVVHDTCLCRVGLRGDAARQSTIVRAKPDAPVAGTA